VPVRLCHSTRANPLSVKPELQADCFADIRSQHTDRARWSKRGIECGDPGVCNTFKAARI
jgi:predicted metalloprotease